MSQPKSATPVAVAVAASVAALAAIFVIALAIGGSYYLTLHAIHVQAAQQAALHAREAGAQIRAAVPTCKALIQMDDASQGLTFAPPQKAGIFEAEIYSARLSKAIHEVVSNTKCARMLQMIHEHIPYPTIARRLGM